MRQVDVKALVSHVIRGDGVNKCRICMGNTSEGQVHLSDTVIMEGDKPVTLSELLEIVTGIQVPLECDLPAGLCVECSTCTINAANFRANCRETFTKWDMTLQLLYNLPSQCSERDKILFAVLDDNKMTFVIDINDLNLDTPSERLRLHLSTPLDLNSTIDRKKVELEECDLKETVKNVQNTSKEGSENEEDAKNDRLVKKRIKIEEHKVKDVERKRCKLDNSETKDVKKNGRLVAKRVIGGKSDRIPQCPNCNKKFGHPLKLYYHLRGSTDMIRACYVCSKIMTRDELVSHLDKVHNMNVYECTKCPALLLTNKKYIQHLSKAHSSGACTCGDCGHTFQSNQAFYAHTTVHRRKICPGCGKVFQNQTCYLHHKKNCRHFLDRNRDCETVTEMTVEDCETVTKMTVEVKNDNRKKNIRVRTRCNTGEVCICDYCGKTFARKKYLTAHIQIVHMKNTHIPCKYCGKFLATAHMTEHLKNHELDLSFKCEHCGIVLKSRLGYVQHLRLHTGERPYACKICKETFSAASRRSEHMRKVHSEADIVLKHACKLCPAKFGLPYRLKKHMKSSHINEGDETLQFECNECHEKFGSCRGLLHHSRIHQKVDFPYKRPEKTIMLQVLSDPNCVEPIN